MDNTCEHSHTIPVGFANIFGELVGDRICLDCTQYMSVVALEEYPSLVDTYAERDIC